MPIYDPENPQQNLEALAANPYPGRLLVIGLSEDGDRIVQAYAIMGRSEGSQNRVFVLNDGIVSTEIADPTKPVGDPELTIYDAMRTVGDTHIVSNGNQTDRVAQYLRSARTFSEAMKATKREPDKPNHTSRITGFYQIDPDETEPSIGISVIRRNKNGHGSIRKLYTDQSPTQEPRLHLSEGFGFGVQTYEGDGNPLPPYTEPPFTIPVGGTAEGMATMLWENLDRTNRVAVVAKTIGLNDGEVEVKFSIINRHQ
jgi:hypothetical protein